jgi:hypothetical protein
MPRRDQMQDGDVTLALVGQMLRMLAAMREGSGTRGRGTGKLCECNGETAMRNTCTFVQ